MLPVYEFGVNVDLPFDQHPLFLRRPYSQFYNLAALATVAQNYDYMGVPIPNSSSVSFDGRETKEGTITVFSHSYLATMGGYSNQPEGFAFSIRDKGAKDYLFSKKFIKSFAISDGLATFGQPRQNSNLLSPFIALSPGQYDWAITNQSSNTSDIQVLLEFCVPVNKENRNNLSITKVA